MPAASVSTSAGVTDPLDTLKLTATFETNPPEAVRTVAARSTDRSGRDAAVRRIDAGVVAAGSEGAGVVGVARPLVLQPAQRTTTRRRRDRMEWFSVLVFRVLLTHFVSSSTARAKT
jgi:hypothetical protein